MKILLFSDTHRQTEKMLAEISRHSKDTDLCIHLGDHIEDTREIRIRFPRLALIAVPGNCDVFSRRPAEELITLFDRRVLIAHGHLMGVGDGAENARYAAARRDAQVVFFGHTHVPFHYARENIVLFNPGSVSLPRAGSGCSYGIVHMTRQSVDCSHIAVQ